MAHEFEEDPPRVEAGQLDDHALVLDIDGYEGPLDVLLDLARSQKVDLAQISILQLARQYLDFVERAKALNLELAAEYLVMAAWLAYLKSRLLLPDDPSSPDPDAADMAEALQFQLRRLEAMRKAADKLMSRPQLGQQVFARGCPEGLGVQTRPVWTVKLLDVIRAYGHIRRRAQASQYDLPELALVSTEEAIQRMTKMLGELPRKGLHSVWTTLDSFIPEGIKNRLFGRSALASALTAGLELAKQGKVEIRQDGLFRPVYVRARTGGADE